MELNCKPGLLNLVMVDPVLASRADLDPREEYNKEVVRSQEVFKQKTGEVVPGVLKISGQVVSCDSVSPPLASFHSRQ